MGTVADGRKGHERSGMNNRYEGVDILGPLRYPGLTDPHLLSAAAHFRRRSRQSTSDETQFDRLRHGAARRAKPP